MKSLLLSVTTIVLGAAASPPAPATDPGLTMLPAELQLSDLAPGSTVKHSVWLINQGTKPVSVLAARGSCGCTAVEFKPATLDPWAVLEVPLTIHTPPGEGRTKNIDVNFTIEDAAAPLKLPVHLQNRGAPADPPQDADVIADPAQLDLGTVVAGQTISTSAHLVNNGDAPRAIEAVSTTCLCVRAVDFQRMELAPGAAADVQLQVDVPAAAGSASRVLTIVVEGKPLLVPLRMVSSHPALDAAKREIARTLPADLAVDDFSVNGNSVSAIAWNQERSAPQGLVTCALDDQGRVTGVRFEPLHPAAPAAS